MKFLRYVVYLLLLSVCALPIIIQAQDAPPLDENGIPVPPALGHTAQSVPCDPNDPDNLLVPLCTPEPTATTAPKPTAQPTRSPDIVNGLWVIRPEQSSFSSSGRCQIPGGDNGGMGGEAQGEELPTLPICMTADSQWLQVDSSAPYPEQMQGVYSQSEMTRELLTENGETSGSVNVTITRAYSVVSPTRIEFTYTRQEQGGCTTSSTIVYELVEPNELVCNGVIVTPEMTPTFLSTPSIDETSQPPVTPEITDTHPYWRLLHHAATTRRHLHCRSDARF